MANEFAEVEDPSMKGVEKLGFKGKNSSTAETTREKQRWERLSQRNVGAGVGRGGRKQSWQYQCNYCDLGDGGLWQSRATGGRQWEGLWQSEGIQTDHLVTTRFTLCLYHQHLHKQGAHHLRIIKLWEISYSGKKRMDLIDAGSTGAGPLQ